MRASPPSRGMSNWNLQAILRDIGAAWRLFWDPKVPTVLKLLLPVAALVYWLSPIDLLPLNPIDDIAVMILALRLFVQLVSPQDAQPNTASQAHTARPADEENVIDTTWRVVK